MSDLIKDIFKDIYYWSYFRIITCVIIGFVIYTLVNLYAPQKLRRVFNILIFICITVTIIFYTLTNRSEKDERSIRLIPFKRLFIHKYAAPKSIWLNAFFFFPYGLSLPYILSDKFKRKVLITILSAACFSLFIEIMQYIFKLGHFETDDVIMNTFGAAIGSLSYIAAIKLRARRTQKVSESSDRKKKQ